MQETVGDVAGRIETLPAPLLPALRDAVAAAGSGVDAAREALARAEVIAGALPRLFGGEGVRRYLLVFQSPSEARGGGGVMGLFGVLRVAQGRPSLSGVGSYSRLGAFPRVDAPAWFERSYAPFKATSSWPQANLSIHFPTTASVLLGMFEGARGEALDGVIAMDPIALQLILPAVGDLRVTGFPEPIGPDNAASVLLHDSYVLSDPETQERALLRLIARFWDRIATGRVRGDLLISGIDAALRSHHLKVFAADPQVQRALALTHATGDFTEFGPRVQVAWHNNVVTNKVDFFLKESIEMDVRIDLDGSASFVTTITFSNEAPSGPPSLLLGPATGFEEDAPGTNRMYAAVALPEGAKVTSFAIDGRPTSPTGVRRPAIPRCGDRW